MSFFLRHQPADRALNDSLACSSSLPLSQRHIYMIMDLATGGELFNLVTKNPGDCATESEIRRMLTNMLSAVRLNSFGCSSSKRLQDAAKEMAVYSTCYCCSRPPSLLARLPIALVGARSTGCASHKPVDSSVVCRRCLLVILPPSVGL